MTEPLSAHDFDSGLAGPEIGFGTSCASVAAALRRLADQFDAERYHPGNVTVVHKAPSLEFHTSVLVLNFHERRK